jgi:aminoglycoside phosphotransferase family enzyme/predicted kinase
MEGRNPAAMTAPQFDPRLLLDPAAYPWPVDDVRLIETHISWVYLAGERVVKLKRPVELGFVDFRDRAKRKQACEDEVRLNKRLTSDVYLGVVPVTAAGVDAEGEPIEWAVVMRRLPAERMLDHLLEEGRAPGDLAEQVADRLIPFHQPIVVAATGRATTEVVSEGARGCPHGPDTYLTVLTDNLDQVAEVAGDIVGPLQLALVDRSMRTFMTEQGDLLENRLSDWLREGHGDLRCEHICLEPDAIQIYDCVEFEIAIRCSDVASDLAFLLMDLRRLGAEPVAAELLERYRAAGFDLSQPVVDLYAAHRALVRAKVAALERSGNDADTDRRQAFEAASYLDIASSFACPVPPMLMLVSGLSGSGKSTVAAALARVTNGQLLASDRVRKELAGLDPSDSAASDWHQGIYTDDWTARTYDRLLELAQSTLVHGQSAIVDATFLDNEQRERFCDVANAQSVPALIVWTELDDAVARARIERRARTRNTASDATVAIRKRQMALLAETPLRVPAGAIAVTIDTGADGPASLDPFFSALDRAGWLRTLQRDGAPSHA